MLRKLRERMEAEKGFTLIELLVVILIIGILAAIAIPSFLSQREKAQDADAKAAARTAQTAIETYFTDQNPNTYAGADANALQSIEATLNDVADADLVVSDAGGAGAADADSYGVQVEAETGHTFRVDRLATGESERHCAPAGDGACPSSGEW